VFQWRIRKI